MLKKIILGLLGIITLIAFGIFVLIQFSTPRVQLEFEDPYHTDRKVLKAENYAVVSGTPWATEAALEVLENGGNAVDAAVAGVLMLNITFGEAASFPGVAPVMYYQADSQKVHSYIGAGTAPEAANIELYQEKGHRKVPKLDILAQLIPASPDVLIRLLQDHGTKSFSELVQPAIDRARNGFPVHHTMAKNLNLSFFERLGYSIMLPTSSEVYFGQKWWLPLKEKDEFKRPLLANTLEELAQAERKALEQGSNRAEALNAVRDYFYKGPITEKIADYHRAEGGLITMEDLANYQGDWETPLVGQFDNYTIYVNSTWTQGIILPLVLQILEDVDLKSMGHNSAEYVHHLAQAIDLSMADREAYITDPAFSKVKGQNLLNKAFAEKRRLAFSENAFKQMPTPGQIDGIETSKVNLPTETPEKEKPNMLNVGDDTSQIVVIDSSGNAIAITPSDFPMSPMIPETGLTLGIRMTQFSLDENHVNKLEPGKRPRITPHAAIIFKDGEFYMAFNTPGGDMQAQALAQAFLNIALFDMDVQTAINAPRFRSKNFPSSFDPDDYSPGLIIMEEDLHKQVANDLIARGYQLKSFPKWDNEFSAVGAILKEAGQLNAGIDPRESGTAAGN